MRIAPPGDEAHLELLARRNKSEASVPETQQVDPVARPEDPTSEETSRRPERPAVERRQGGDRRKGDRRERVQNVLLDTRESRERRRVIRRREDRERLDANAPESAPDQPEEPAEEKPRRGIDLFA